MVSALWHLVLKMIWNKKGRILFSVAAIALGIGLVCSISQLHLILNEDVKQRLQYMHGSADMRISAPPPLDGSERRALEPATEAALVALDEIQQAGQAIDGGLPFEGQTDTFEELGFTYAGVDNASVTKEYYRFEQDLSSYEVALSPALVENLKAEVGEYVSFPLESGQEVEWRISEILPEGDRMSGFPDERALFHLASLQELFGLNDAIQSVVFALEPSANIPALIESLRHLETGLHIDVLHGVEDEEVFALNLRVLGYVLSLVAFLAAVILTRGMIQTTYRERLKELAIVRAVGGSREQLGRMVLYETAIIATLGAGIGILIGWLAGQGGIYWASEFLNLDLLATYSGRQVRLLGILIMLAIAAFGWLAVMIASLSIVWKVSNSEPVQSFREAVDNREEASETDKKRGKNCLLLAGIGAVLLLLSMLFEGNTGIRVLVSGSAGIIIVFALFRGIELVFAPLLRLFSLFPDHLFNGIPYLAVQRLVLDRKQNVAPVMVLVMIIVVYVPITSSIQANSEVNPEYIEERFKTDFVIDAKRELMFYPQVPFHIRTEIESWKGVELIIPLPVSNRTPMVDFDFNQADPDWANQSDEWRKELFYGFTNLKAMSELELFTLPDIPLDEAAALPKSMADNMA